MQKRKLTVIPGDGIGPSLVESAIQVMDRLDCGFEYETVAAGVKALENMGALLPDETLASIRQNKIALKGPLMTPVGEGFTSVNVALRQEFDLYANLRPAISFPGVNSHYDDINIITIRQNTEGMYSGAGQEINDDETIAKAMSIVTKDACERIVHFAFETARKCGRKKITLAHKANILKTTSGLFLKTGREVAVNYPEIECNDLIVDNCCMQLVMNPHQFDMIVTTNLLGDIISDICAGLVGGLGMTPGANIGGEIAIFEAVHGSAPDIAGKNIANPCSLLLASAQLCDHVELYEQAKAIRQAIQGVLFAKDRLTADLGGSATTTEFTQAILDRI
ncbi:isocitrate dehydrogenase [Candidatus Omnitrophota bacterium]